MTWVVGASNDGNLVHLNLMSEQQHISELLEWKSVAHDRFISIRFLTCYAFVFSVLFKYKRKALHETETSEVVFLHFQSNYRNPRSILKKQE